MADKTEIMLATNASASVARSRTLALLYLAFKSQLLLLLLPLQAGALTKFESQSVSCSAKSIDLPH